MQTGLKDKMKIYGKRRSLQTYKDLILTELCELVSNCVFAFNSSSEVIQAELNPGTLQSRLQ